MSLKEEEDDRNSCDIPMEEKSTEVVLYADLFPEEPPSLEEEICRGIKELRLRQRTQRKHLKKKKKVQDPKIAKIIYPEPTEFHGCRHNETIIIDRELLMPEEHLKLLAMAKPKPQPEYARLVYRSIPEATNHIKTLAQPKALHVRDTINRHGKLLRKAQVDRMNERLNARDYLTLQESHQFALQQRRDEKRWLRHRARQARTLKRRIVQLEVDYLRGIMQTIYRKTRTFFLEESSSALDSDLLLASDVILEKICHLIGVQVPRRDGADIMDQHYCQMAEKMAAWMGRIMQTAGVSFERPEDMEKRLSAASSIFEDPTLRPPTMDDVGEKQSPTEPLIVDEETMTLISEVVENCIMAAVTAARDGGSRTTFSMPPDAGVAGGGQSVSQMIMPAPSEETTKTMREKGSKVNFMPRVAANEFEPVEVDEEMNE